MAGAYRGGHALPEDSRLYGGSEVARRQAVKDAAVENPATDRPSGIKTKRGEMRRAPGHCTNAACGRHVEFRDAEEGTCAKCTPWWWNAVKGDEHDSHDAERARRAALTDEATRDAKQQRRTDRRADRARDLRLGGGHE